MTVSDYEYSIYSSVLGYGKLPSFRRNHELGNLKGFSSLYSVSKQESENITAAGTISGFKGSVWSERLWVDVDSYDSADAVESKLKELGYDYLAYDSGGKGAHFGISRETRPSHLLPEQDKHWVQTALSGIPGIDTSIYTHLHLFRLPGTTHERTGRPKELVEHSTGTSLVHGSYIRPVRTSDPSPYLANGTGDKSVFSSYQVMSQVGKVRVGGRHASLVKSAYGLRDTGIPVAAARWWLLELNKHFEEPKREEEIEKILQDVYQG